jgi:phage terminase large subunit-like protein
VDFCDSFGLHLDPWQQYVIRHSLGERRDGKFAAFEVGLVVPRQCGKGAVLEARELAGLFLFGEKLILHSAHEFKTAQEGFRRVLAHLEGNDWLRKRVSRVRTSHGDEGIELRNGGRLRFVARSTGSGRGFTGDVVILDEAYNLASEGMAALLPTLSARPNPQIWYTSSAGMATSDQLRSVRERGVAGSSRRLAYFEWSVDKDADLDDQQNWAIANPALGIRIDHEFVQSERDAMDDLAFSRERLGVWFDPEENSLVANVQAVWPKLADPDSQPSDPVVFALDVEAERNVASISVAGRRADGLGHVEVVDTREGTAWAVPRMVELYRKWRPVSVIVDPASGAGSFLNELQENGIEPELVTGREMAQACGEFYEACVEKQDVRHRGQKSLHIALKGAQTRDMSDAWVWHRRNSTTYISPLVSVTMAWHGYLKHCANPAPQPWFSKS